VATRHDQALLLRRSPYGESSLTAQVLTRDNGRVDLLAKGAYRPTSRFFCVLDLFDTLELEWSHTNRSSLMTMQRGDVLIRRRALRDDLERYSAGLAMLELTHLAARRQHVDRELFDVVSAGLDRLLTSAQPDLARAVFELEYLRVVGLGPALETCASCGGEAPALAGQNERVAFSAGAGGRLCARCAVDARHAGRRVGTMPVTVLEAAVELPRLVRAGGPAASVDPAGLVLVRDFLERFIDYHLELRPRMQRDFLASPNRNAPGREPRQPILQRPH